MKQLDRLVKPVAAFIGFLGVALGAFGSHALRESVSVRMFAVWNTATLYLFVHVFASIIASRVSGKTALLFSAGTLIFSGSLYLMVLTGNRHLGFLTPIGGLIYLTAWASLTYIYYKENE